MEKKRRWSYYLFYSAFFCLLAALIAYYYFSKGTTLIDANGDGFRQHYKALVYYSRYLKEFFANLSKGRFSLPEWDFVIGEGADVLMAFHYYAIGDIFTFFSFLCPEEYMYHYYDLSTIMRIYVSGLGFLVLCLYKKKEDIFAIVSGALLYAFSSFSFTSMSGHVFFISAAAFLPFIILGCEKVIDHDDPALLVIAVMLSSLSNIYFFYMNVLSTVLYVLIRLLFMKETWKNRLFALLRIGLYATLGLGMSFIIFLPMASKMFQSNRLDSDVSFGMFFSLKEYKAIFKTLTFRGTYLGDHSIFWPVALSYLILKKKDRPLIALLITAILFVSLPHLSKIYNAFTYPIDRWCYAVSLLMAYLVSECLQDLKKVNELFYVNLILFVIYYGICILIDRSYWQLHAMFLVLSVFVLGFLRFIKIRKFDKLLCFLAVLFGLFFRIYYDFSPTYWNVPDMGADLSSIQDMKNDEHSVFEDFNDETFFRYSGNRMTVNQTILGEHSSTQYYWSIANDYVVDFRKSLGYSDNSNHHYANYGERFAQNALSGVKYYVNKVDDRLVPYGFSFVDRINGYDVYESPYALDLVYVYDNYILRVDFDKLDTAEKNELLSKAAVVENDLDLIDHKDVASKLIDVSYQLEKDEDIAIDSDHIAVSGQQAKIYLEGECDRPGEYYVLVDGLYSDELVAYIRVRYEDIEKYFIFKGNDNQHYTDRHDYLVDLGYLDGLDGVVSLDFSDGGSYTYHSIRIICQPLEDQIAELEKRSDIQINELEIQGDRVYTHLSIPEDGLLCFSIPYSKGWKAYVDGKEAALLNCNIQYLGLEAIKGEHVIELRYSTPLLKPGLAVSLLSTVLFIYIELRTKKRKTLS
ncbi:MAG: YfhO family protein [Erysipelotrichaceae bacterium]|nr:YfhO family protein [Erysipelotrichaceae bacterium]